MRGFLDRLKKRVFGSKEKSKDSEILDMIHDLPDGVFCVDPNWKLLYLNQKAEEIAGRKKHELLGKNLWDEYPELIGTYIHAQYMAAMTKQKMIRFEGYLPQFDAWFETSLYPKQGGLFIYFRDVSEVRKQRRAVNDFAQRAESAYRDLEEMIYLVSHDLKEPMRMISSFLELLKEKSKLQQDKESKEFFTYLEKASSDLKNRINHLVDYSQASDLSERTTNIDVKKMINDLIADAKNHNRNQSIKAEVANLPEVYGVKTKIKQLLEILLKNSIKFSNPDEDVLIKISSRIERESIIISWEDRGIGIDERYKNRVFQIFQQLAPKKEISGVGMGLAFARKIVQAHGGYIKLVPGFQRGARFEISLPIQGELVKKRENIFRLVS